MKLTIVILTRNNIATIEECIESTMSYYKDGHINEIIVVDGHSTDGTQEIVKKYPIKFFQDDHKGIANARNIGWRKASGEIILFLDSDAYLEKGFLPRILNFFEDENIAAVGCRVISVTKNNIMKTTGEWQSYHYDRLRKNLSSSNSFSDLYFRIIGLNNQIFISGPVYAIRRKCLEEINGFDEKHKSGGEEINLSKKLVDLGWKLTWWLDAPVYHHPRDSIRALIQERCEWGKGDYLFIIQSNENRITKAINLSLALISRIGSPVLGLWLAIKFKNPLHIMLFTLANYSWLKGFIIELASTRGGNVNE